MPRARNTTTDLRTVVKNKWDSLGSLESRGGLTWKDADANLLRGAVAAVTGDGAALLLTTTSDGGALCLQVWTEAARHKLYPATATELTEALQLLIETASS